MWSYRNADPSPGRAGRSNTMKFTSKFPERGMKMTPFHTPSLFQEGVCKETLKD